MAVTYHGYLSYAKDKEEKGSQALFSVPAVCYFHRQAGRSDNGNCLESGEVRGNMLSSAFPGLLSIFRGKNLYVGNYSFLYADKPCIINGGIVATP